MKWRSNRTWTLGALSVVLSAAAVTGQESRQDRASDRASGPVDIIVQAIAPLNMQALQAIHLPTGTAQISLSHKRVLDDLLRDTTHGDPLPTGTARELARIVVTLDHGTYRGIPIVKTAHFFAVF